MSLENTESNRLLLDLVANGRRGVLVTLRGDGRPQLSNIFYAWDPATATASVSVTDDRAKTRNVRRDSRVSLHVASDDFWSYAVLDGSATLSAVAEDPHGNAADELADLYRTVSGAEHPDWEEFRRTQVADRRLVLRLHASHVYGVARG
jgi:PPOX class probable F420-dependent enzyme